MTEPVHPAADDLDAARDALNAAVGASSGPAESFSSRGVTAAESLESLGQATAMLSRRRNPVPVCGDCGAPATHQAPRDATDEEADAHWSALEQNIRESGNPEYVQDRGDTVAVAVHRCDDHPHPGYAEARANEEPTDGE